MNHPHRHNLPFFVVALGVAAALGCGSETRSGYCEVQADCFRDELCVDNACVVPGANNTPGNNSPGNNTSPNNEPGNNSPGNNEPGNNTPSNNTPGNNTSTNNEPGNNEPGNNEPGNNAAPDLACLVNPFVTSCADPEPRQNNEWHSGVPLNNNKNVGCPSADNFVAVDEVYSGVLCHNEPADWFRLGAVHCDTRSFVVDITLTPKTVCDPAFYSLMVYNKSCDDETVMCIDDAETGARRIILNYPPPSHPVVFSIYVGLVAEETGIRQRDVQLEYDLHVVAR